MENELILKMLDDARTSIEAASNALRPRVKSVFVPFIGKCAFCHRGAIDGRGSDDTLLCQYHLFHPEEPERIRKD